MNNDIKFLNIEWRSHDIPSQILKPIYFLDPNVWFLAHLYVALIPNSSGQLAELIVQIIPLE